MRRIDLTHCDLSWALLAGANLTEANLSYSNLGDANFSYAMLLSALFNDADLRGANLRHTELTAAVFNGVRLSERRPEQGPSLWNGVRPLSRSAPGAGPGSAGLPESFLIDLEPSGTRCRLSDELLEGVGLERARSRRFGCLAEPGPWPDLGSGRAQWFQLGEHPAEQVGGRLEMAELAAHSR